MPVDENRSIGWGKSMIKHVSFAAMAVGSLALANLPAKAAPVDMSTITCAQMMSMKEDEVTFMLTWVAGYMAGAAEETSMDPDALGKHVTDVVKYCQANQEMSVMNAAKESVPQ